MQGNQYVGVLDRYTLFVAFMSFYVHADLEREREDGG